MVVILNGKEIQVSADLTVLGLLEAREIGTGSVVVEVNREIVPEAAFGETKLNDGDHLEVLRFVGGG
jgi:sulfur carrier protein